MEHTEPETSAAPLPKISIVTPSFNQGRFIAQTLGSVRAQVGVEIEHIVMDGGSTDETVSVIRSHEDGLAHWQSEPDGGQTDALIKGFGRATGEVFGWLNSDDYFWSPRSMRAVARAFADHPEVDMVTGDMIYVTEDREPILIDMVWQPTAEQFDYHMAMTQQATFWRRSAYERVGGLDPDFHFCMDFDLFGRMSRKGKIMRIPEIISAFRLHHAAKTYSIADVCKSERARLLQRSTGRKHVDLRGHMLGMQIRAGAVRAQWEAFNAKRTLPTQANARIELMSFPVLRLRGLGQ